MLFSRERIMNKTEGWIVHVFGKRKSDFEIRFVMNDPI